jgi:hypothetical protein
LVVVKAGDSKRPIPKRTISKKKMSEEKTRQMMPAKNNSSPRAEALALTVSCSNSPPTV